MFWHGRIVPSRRMAASKSLKLAWIPSLLLCGALLAAPNADAEEFIDKMLLAVGARRVACAEDVALETKAREMEAVCAVFDGKFESFEGRWTRYLRPDTVRDASSPFDRTRPLTSWEFREDAHERIYAVGHVALGVRFTDGRILMAYR